MNMKHTLLAAGLAIACGSLALAPAANAADGTITINGKVLSSTCTVSNATAGNVAVTLPDVVYSAFTTTGSAAGLTPFSLNLTGCPTTPSGVVVAARFSGSNIDAATGALKNGTGTSNVEVQLTNSAGTAINLSTNPTPVNATISGTGAATLSYQAQYYQPSATAITAGTVNTSVDFTLTYN